MSIYNRNLDEHNRPPRTCKSKVFLNFWAIHSSVIHSWWAERVIHLQDWLPSENVSWSNLLPTLRQTPPMGLIQINCFDFGRKRRSKKHGRTGLESWSSFFQMISKAKKCFKSFFLTEQLCLLQCLNIESQAESERNGQIRSSEIINNIFTFLTSMLSSRRTLLGEFCSETEGKKYFIWKRPQKELSLLGFYHL